MKGGGAIGVSIKNGAVTVHQWLGTGFEPEKVDFDHEEIWTGNKPNLIRSYPEFLIGRLAEIGRKQEDFGVAYSFPIVGFLWLWLAAGVYGEMKLLRHPAAIPEGISVVNAGSRRRVAVLGGAMLALIAIIAVADHMLCEEKVAASCAGSITNIRYFLWRKHVGEILRWDQYRGGSGASRPQDLKCPSGAPYQFSPVRSPRDGAQCSRSDHRRYLDGTY